MTYQPYTQLLINTLEGFAPSKQPERERLKVRQAKPEASLKINQPIQTRLKF
jgi:hypothetical protein